MIWTYRALNNPASRKKWIIFVFVIILAGFGYTGYKILSGGEIGKSLIVAAIFALFVSLYAIITLGKPRHYYIEGDYVYYRPFKTNLREIEDFEVCEEKKLIKLKGAGILSVRTLYFENQDDMKQVVRKLNKILGKI
ncbi:hypothetical protein [Archaeoglobus neptunius]|uniref:hypothetical protein n=1 Tax=Archaeoglobus neptunius TaxID=2798580 RepID=UPI0019289961|nr:hypothetical protein [Archaeoglobus neptunius]